MIFEFNAVTCKSIIGTLIIICMSGSRSGAQEQPDMRTVIDSLEISEHGAVTAGKKIIFMLRFADLGCQPCLQNFFELCDSIGMVRTGSRKIPLYLFFLQEKSNPGYQLTTMTSWAKSSGLPYPVALVSQEVFKRHGIGHSSVLIIGDKDTLYFRRQIPVSREDFSYMIRTIQK